MTPFSALMVILGMELLALLALLGDRRFSLHEKIPVYWGKKDRPNIYAPRRLGLSILPVIGSVLLLALALARQQLFVLTIVELAMATLNLLYFHAISRTFAKL